MTDWACITNYDLSHLAPADRLRPCVRRGQHYAACDNPDDHRGCVPRSAKYGYLCVVCWEKLTDALGRVGWLIAHLRSIETNGTNPGEKVDRSQERSILIPDSWIAADGLMQALGGKPIPSTASIDDAIRLASDAVSAWGDGWDTIQTPEGAEEALVLVRRTQTALHRWPDAEVEYRTMPQVLCPSCHTRNLRRRAPLEYLDDMYVECGNCEYRKDYFEWMLKHEEIVVATLDAIDAAEGRKPRRRPARTIRTSGACVGDDHDGCSNLSCTCECHARTYSLWTPKENINRIREKTA